MKKLLNYLSAFNRSLCRFLLNASAICLAVLSTLLFCSVIARYVFNSPLAWSEAILKFLMVLMAILVVPAALREGEHVAMEMLIDKTPASVKSILRLISILVILFVGWIFLKYGWVFALKGMRRIVPSVSWLRFGFVYMTLPLGYGLMLFAGTEILLKNVAALLPRTK